ncbi:MAG: acireductone synthase [Proteobacteria bacterium]|nr:acireductone synthase [Pseudomonadota bacterium]
MIKAIITDIEGTTTDINFVHKVLFPYSRQKMAAFLNHEQNKPHVITELGHVRHEMGKMDASLDEVIDQLIAWIDKDEKIAPLKNIQGFIWLQGFEKGEFKGHLYQDAYDNLCRWHNAGIKLYVYSSGSVKAQQLLFKHSDFGDIRYLFSGFFDTSVGAKKEPSSYHNILEEIQFLPNETLFLSDVVDELNAASVNGIQTRLLNRDNQVFAAHSHPVCLSFNDIKI